MSEFFGPAGPLAERFAAFEERQCQVSMAEAVDRTFDAGGRLFVEAGTGTGKTFAYLVPALLHAEVPDRRVVIATWTRNLQEQLVEKDLPLLRELVGARLEAALVLGRENYVCRRRAELAARQGDLGLDRASHARELRRLADWAATSPLGTRGRLDFEPRPEAWAAVRAERGNCLHARSPFYKTCVWQDAKRRAREAAVLIVNHALLLEDLKLRRTGGSLLPSYSMLVVDEAHHLEEVAADHLGSRVTRGAVLGLLRGVARVASDVLEDDAARAQIEVVLQRARAATAELYERVVRWLAERGVATLDANAALPAGLPLLLQELHDRLKEAAARTTEEGERGELLSKAVQALALAENVDGILEHGAAQGNPAAAAPSDVVAFAEKVDDGGDVAICAAPIEPGPMLERELFAPLHAAVLTSATLAVAPPPDRFAWLARGSGIGDATKLVLPSPFDYRRQARVIVDPLPEPSDPAAWTQAMIERIPTHVQRTHGRAFVLFTSRKTMEAVADGARGAIERLGVRLLVQGRGMPRTTLLEEFRTKQPAALFGLASFWEGVDVPGRELSHVILTRLPFPVPDHPLEKARSELLKRSGSSPFHALSLPKAVLRFKQGFGRLIRRRDDQGFVTVLDARLIRRRYGRVFLDALPDCQKVVLRDGEEVPFGEEEAA